MPARSAEMWRKHGLDFSFALPVFSDPWGDAIRPRCGQRGAVAYNAVAAGSVFKVLLVVHTYPDLDDDASGSGSLACVKPIPGSGGDMKSRTNDRAMPPHLLTEAQIGQLKALEGRAPDTVDIPPAPETNWATAVRGKHSAAIQGTVSVCLDAEVMAWLRAQGPNCGAEINLILRAKMAAETVT
jgi:uncharacterized protein (DUF4415 family)